MNQNRKNASPNAFYGKTFFFDLEQNDPAYFDLKYRVEKLGGIIEPTFSGNVNVYVCFDSFQRGSKKDKSADKKAAGGGDGPDDNAQKMRMVYYKMALTKNIEIRTFDRLRATLEDYEKAVNSNSVIRNSNDPAIELTSKSSVLKCQSLREPFIKIEDLSLNYRPIYYEMTSMPNVVTNYLIRTSPFFYPHRITGLNHARTSMKNSEMAPAQQPNVVGFLHSSGYCEICEREYRHINTHIHSRIHHEFARNNSNYRQIDTIVSQGFYKDRSTSRHANTQVVPLIPYYCCTVPMSVSLQSDMRPLKSFSSLSNCGMFHHSSGQQVMTLYFSCVRNTQIQQKTLEYLQLITFDSSVHPTITSMSTMPLVLDNYYNYPATGTICVIESKCFVPGIHFNLSTPLTTAGAKLTLACVNVDSPEFIYDWLILLYTYLDRTTVNSSYNNMSSGTGSGILLDSTKQLPNSSSAVNLNVTPNNNNNNNNNNIPPNHVVNKNLNNDNGVSLNAPNREFNFNSSPGPDLTNNTNNNNNTLNVIAGGNRCKSEEASTDTQPSSTVGTSMWTLENVLETARSLRKME